MANKETFGQFIARLRNEKDMKRVQLASALNMDSTTLSKIENGTRHFQGKYLPDLAKTFGLDLNELKKEYYSEEIAKMLYENGCDSDVLTLAEEKVAYIKASNTRQSNLNF